MAERNRSKAKREAQKFREAITELGHESIGEFNVINDVLKQFLVHRCLLDCGVSEYDP